MEAQTNDRTDLHLALWSTDAPLMGLRIQSRQGGFPLIDGGRAANLKFEQTGIRFSAPAIHKINRSDDPENVAEEMADVRIMLDQLELIFRNGQKVARWEVRKLRRLDQRVHAADVIGEEGRT